MKRLALVLLSLCAACDRAPAPPSASASSSAAVPLGLSIEIGKPNAQEDLLALIHDVQNNPKDTTLYNRFCDSFLHISEFDRWTGQVSDFRTSTVNQSIDIAFDMGKPMHFEQVIQPSAPLYETIKKLKMGDYVQISGRFTHVAGSSECAYYLGSYSVEVSKLSLVGHQPSKPLP